MSKTYKGYQLAEALDNGLFSKEQRVNGAGYFECTIGFILKDIGNNFLFKDFEIIEELDIQSIEEIDKSKETNIWAKMSDCEDMANKLVQAVKQLDKNIKEK